MSEKLAKQERDEQIGLAAFSANDHQDAMWEDLTLGSRMFHIDAAVAAVSRAYEIDGVDKLVEAAQQMIDDGGSMCCSTKAKADLRSALASVREARGE